jgi:hypothetical protein
MARHFAEQPGCRSHPSSYNVLCKLRRGKVWNLMAELIRGQPQPPAVNSSLESLPLKTSDDSYFYESCLHPSSNYQRSPFTHTLSFMVNTRAVVAPSCKVCSFPH